MFFLIIFVLSCTSKSSSLTGITEQKSSITSLPIADENSWSYFLQHLPEKNAPIVDYKGNIISYQQKHVAIIPYDVGNEDLQQCADALMRLRAEYLFTQKRFDEIGFHFVSGQYYTWNEYCKGLRPIAKGNSVKFITAGVTDRTHASLRKYLDIVYAYASTISLATELKNTNRFEIGTVIIHPGSPGHCFIITDEAATSSGEKVYKLVEGYTPAQSIYVVRNLQDESLSEWYRLKAGPISTASYNFNDYKMKKFE